MCGRPAGDVGETGEVLLPPRSRPARPSGSRPSEPPGARSVRPRPATGTPRRPAVRPGRSPGRGRAGRRPGRRRASRPGSRPRRRTSHSDVTPFSRSAAIASLVSATSGWACRCRMSQPPGTPLSDALPRGHRARTAARPGTPTALGRSAASVGGVQRCDADAGRDRAAQRVLDRVGQVLAAGLAEHAGDEVAPLVPRGGVELGSQREVLGDLVLGRDLGVGVRRARSAC